MPRSTRTAWRKGISALRRALDQKPGENSYMVTLPDEAISLLHRCGLLPQRTREPGSEHLALVPDAATVASYGPSSLLDQQQTIPDQRHYGRQTTAELARSPMSGSRETGRGFGHSCDHGFGNLGGEAVAPNPENHFRELARARRTPAMTPCRTAR